MGKFKIGDKVRFIGDFKKHIQQEELREVYDKKEILEISKIDYAGDYEVLRHDWCFQESELELVDPMEQITQGVLSSIKIGEFPTHNHVLTWDGNISDLCSYEPTSTYVSRSYVDEKINELKVKEKNYMKILEIYSREAIKKIENDYDNLVNKIIEEDKIQKLILETENQINIILDKDEDEAICLGHRGLLEPKNKDKIKQLQNEKYDKMRKLDEFLEKVQARLEICDDTECSKAEVLMIYGVLDEEGKIAEYKIEKKGKK